MSDRLSNYFVDTHCHLQWPTLAADVDLVLERSRAQGVGRMLTLGTDAASSLSAVSLSARFDEVFAAVGLHPGDVTEESLSTLPDIEALLEDEKIVAIGECGLDYFHKDNAPRALQLQAFERQLEWAVSTGKPICIHNRDATEDVMGILHGYSGRVTPVLHCFTGNMAVAADAINMGAFVSFAGNVSYPKMRSLLEVIASIPEENLLLETDSPFLSPQPVRGQRNEPSHVVLTYETVALALSVSIEDLKDRVAANADRAFGWA